MRIARRWARVIAGAGIVVVALLGGGVATAEPGGGTMRDGADAVGQPGDVAPMICLARR